MKELSQAFILKCLYPSFCVSEECPGLTPIEEDGDDQGFVELDLVWKLMLLFHTLVSLAITAVAVAIHIQISVLQIPSFVRVAPKYLKLDTSSSFSPSIMMLTLALFVLFTFTLDFTVLISIPYAPTVAMSLLVSSCSSLLLPTMRLILSAKHKLQIGLPPMDIVVVWL